MQNKRNFPSKRVQANIFHGSCTFIFLIVDIERKSETLNHWREVVNKEVVFNFTIFTYTVKPGCQQT